MKDRTFKAIDDLPPDRMENAILMWQFLRELFGKRDCQTWYFNADNGEQHRTLDDLANAGYVALVSDNVGRSFAVPIRYRAVILLSRGIREI